MNSKKMRLLSVLMILVIISTLFVGCGKNENNVDPNEQFQTLLNSVKYSSELTKVENNAELYFPDLPDGSNIELYTAGGYYADELALLTFVSESDCNSAEAIVKQHVAELREQFSDYVLEEVGKIDKAIIYKNGKYMILCITDDYKTAQDIISGKTSSESQGKSQKATGDKGNSGDKTPTHPSTTSVKNNYPSIKSKTGEYQVYDSSAIRVDDSAYELYTYVDSTADSYAMLINKTASELKGKTNVYVLPIPTAIGIILPDDIATKLPNNPNQGSVIKKINSKMSSDVETVDCYDNMMMHRNEYLYFRTDFHWNGLGAFYAYESFCKAKGIEPIPLAEHTEKQFDGFLGELYWKNSKKDQAIGNTSDTVYAYCPKSSTATMEYIDRDGKSCAWVIINDVTDYKSSVKYSTFAAGDNPIAVFKNPEITDGSTCIVVKESFGNALLPFLVDHYSIIYEIDYRYWDGNLISFAKEVNANDLLFANNLSMIRSNYLVGKLSGIVG